METQNTLKQQETAYYNSQFKFHMDTIQLQIDRLMEIQKQGILSRTQINRNLKAVEWLNSTLDNNLEEYGKQFNATLEENK